MSNAIAIFRSLLIYSVCLPLAVILGYVVAVPLDFTSLSFVVLVLMVLAAPILIRWHHPLLIAIWNIAAVVFFLPGRPNLWMPMALLSLIISLLERGLNKKMKFISVPPVTWPLIFLTAVILVTAKLTGGIGLGSLGSEVAGGRRYFLLFGAIAGYFALTARPVSPKSAALLVSLYFLGGLTAVIANMVPLIDPSLYFIFAVFPVEKDLLPALTNDVVMRTDSIFRAGGLSIASTLVYYFMLAHYGIREIFDLRKYWRLLLFLGIIVLGIIGGYRAVAITLLLTFAIQFYFEGLIRSRLMPVLLIAGVLVLTLCVAMMDKMPLSVQRSLSFLPVEVDPVARYSADATSDWRLRMWRALLPEVPKYLIVGKGYKIDPVEWELMQVGQGRGGGDDFEWAIMAGDYHNGPLSVILPLGIMGVVGFVWFLVAATRVLYQNYKYGDPALKKINTFLLAYFIAKFVMFLAVFGAFYSEFYIYTGIIGLSVSLNGGVRRPASEEPETQIASNKLSLARAAK